MKIIGRCGSKKYIAEVEHEEIEKFLDLYYGKKDECRIDEVINLGQGYDYQTKIFEAVRKMDELVKSCEDITSAIKAGRVIAKLKKQTN